MPYSEPPALSAYSAYVWELENVGVIYKLKKKKRVETLCVCARALIGGAFMRAVSTFHVSGHGVRTSVGNFSWPENPTPNVRPFL